MELLLDRKLADKGYSLLLMLKGLGRKKRSYYFPRKNWIWFGNSVRPLIIKGLLMLQMFIDALTKIKTNRDLVRAWPKCSHSLV